MKRIKIVGLVLMVTVLMVWHAPLAHSQDSNWFLVLPWPLELRSYNKDHPELGAGEIFLTNAEPDEFYEIKWKTKRMGEIAYDRNGYIIYSRRLVPVFVQKSEISRDASYLSLEILLNGPTL